MKYPTLSEMETSREWTDAFGGYNHNLRIGNGEFYDMKNLTGDDYPVLSPRGKRGQFKVIPTKPQGLIAKDALCWVDGSDFYINGDRHELGLTIDSEPKQLVSMGAYVIILPDKKYINTSYTDDQGAIEVTNVTAQGETVTFTPTLANGETANIQPSNTPPTVTEEMIEKNEIPFWLDTSESPNTLKVYSTSDELWTAVVTSYVKITAKSTEIGNNLKVGDTVTISGITQADVTDLNASCTIVDIRDDGKSIVVTGLAKKVEKQSTPICISRWMPDMDFVIESQNRLWGCCYDIAYLGQRYWQAGERGKGTEAGVGPAYGGYVNEIYSCKLGDFTNWQTFTTPSLATDSYTVPVGTDGVFTGAITHLGYPIFFKENCMHKVYGDYPTNFRVQTTACRGVQKGCSQSLAIVNEIVYYKSRSGIMAYDGSLPTEVSAALGDISYSDARAGSLGNKYYVSMKNDEDEEFSMFVYDTKKGFWHKEDETKAKVFCNCRGNLYFIAEDSHETQGANQIVSVRVRGENDVYGDFEWGAVTGLIGTDSPDKKYISRLDVRMMLAPGASVSFYAEYDSSGEYEHIFNMTGVNLKSFAVPIKPKRCDHMRLKIEGKGEAKIFSICKTVEWGSDK